MKKRGEEGADIDRTRLVLHESATASIKGEEDEVICRRYEQ